MNRCKKCGYEYEGKRCKPCFAEYMREWRVKNPEKVKKNKQKEFQKNKERYYKSFKRWASENPNAAKKIKARYRENHREELREKGRKYYNENTEKYAENQKKIDKTERDRRWKEKYPAKYECKKLYVYACRKGELVRPKICSECRAKGKIQGHHEDYTKPLEVIWLCEKCHMRRHRK